MSEDTARIREDGNDLEEGDPLLLNYREMSACCIVGPLLAGPIKTYTYIMYLAF